MVKCVSKCAADISRAPSSATAVASGAVLRALNKENGPRRFARSSYGLLRSEPYGDYPEQQKGVRPYYDPDDGLPYVWQTIKWVVKRVSPDHKTSFLPCLFRLAVDN